MRVLLIKIIIYFCLTHKQRFLRLLAKLEYGVAIFCFKMAKQAESENYGNLARLLKSHGEEEIKHGKMLASIADGSSKITLNSSYGRWISLKRVSNNEDLMKPSIDPEVVGKKYVWDSIKFPGDQIEGIYENLDGLSQRYFSMRLLLNGKKASDLDWVDRLAFMHVLELGTKQFYQVLQTETSSRATSSDTALCAIASQITRDESDHADYLRHSLRHFSYFSDTVIKKWEWRLNLALWGLLVDAWKFYKQS